MLSRYIPILNWLPQYQRRWFTGDLVAGLTVWAIIVPHSLVYALIVGVPLELGLYAAIAGLFFFAIFSSFRLLMKMRILRALLLENSIVLPFCN